jgi:hypothetical protein
MDGSLMRELVNVVGCRDCRRPVGRLLGRHPHNDATHDAG